MQIIYFKGTTYTCVAFILYQINITQQCCTEIYKLLMALATSVLNSSM